MIRVAVTFRAHMPTCSNCGSETPDGARFCSRCGAAQKESPGAPQLPFAQPRARESWDVCEIGWWRGYVKSEFYAAALTVDGSEYEVGRSPQFRWRRTEAPPSDHERARAAHAALVDRLAATGWEPVGGGVPWFAQRFRRRATGLRLLQGEPTPEPVRDEDSTRN